MLKLCNIVEGFIIGTDLICIQHVNHKSANDAIQVWIFCWCTAASTRVQCKHVNWPKWFAASDRNRWL